MQQRDSRFPGQQCQIIFRAVSFAWRMADAGFFEASVNDQSQGMSFYPSSQ
jgi:hypothetical protein